jgi:hypothetical protein
MERERGLDGKDLCAQAMVAIIFFSFAPGHEKFFRAKAFSGTASCQWEVYSAAFSSGVITGWLGSRKKKKTVPEPKVAAMQSLGAIRQRTYCRRESGKVEI